MSLNFPHVYPLLGLITGTATVAAIVSTHIPAANAKTAQEVARIAIATTVQINDPTGSGGSGVIVAKQGNTYLVLTANHVVSDTGARYTIRTAQGKDYAVSNVQRLQQNKAAPDLAVVRFTSSDALTVAVLSNSDQATAGADIFVSGYPSPGIGSTARTHEFTNGIVTSRPSNRPQGYTLRYNAVTRSGMSGGPVFDVGGRVIGIHGQGDIAGEARGESSDSVSIKTGFNAAIPVNTFMGMLAQIGLAKSAFQVDTTPSSGTLAANQSDPARTAYVQGLVNSDEGNKKAAIQALDKAISLNPKNADAYRERGAARLGTIEDTDIAYASPLNREVLRQAMEDFSQSIRLNPQDALAYANRGGIRYYLGEKDAAFEDINRAIALAPEDAEVYVRRGSLYLQRKEYQKALDNFEQALRLRPQYAGAYSGRGFARQSLKDYQGAIEEYTQVLQINPDNYVGYNNRGAARMSIKDYDGAFADFTQALRINPKAAATYGLRGFLRYKLNDKAGALSDFQKAADLWLEQGRTDRYKDTAELIRKVQSGGSISSDDCYIATATLKGGGAEAHLDLLRGWRDEVMKPTWMGQWLLKLYKTIGPVVASQAEKSTLLAMTCLFPFILPGIWLVQQRQNHRWLSPFLDPIIYSIFLLGLSYGMVLYGIFRWINLGQPCSGKVKV